MLNCDIKKQALFCTENTLWIIKLLMPLVIQKLALISQK